MLVQTRRGALVQDRWPDLLAAAEQQLPHGLVLDVAWDAEAGRLSFEALQRRAVARARGAASTAARRPPNDPNPDPRPGRAYAELVGGPLDGPLLDITGWPADEIRTAPR
ncbi:hypothetical protein EDD91_7292 [Streptomyces sp. KS 21]|nr:hypothetical protein EDD91_7292 [Streptomyces sp. KS 21]